MFQTYYGSVENDPAFLNISDEEIIREIKQDMPDIGYNMTRGVLQARGVYFTIPRILHSLQEVDPMNLRWAAPISC